MPAHCFKTLPVTRYAALYLKRAALADALMRRRVTSRRRPVLPRWLIQRLPSFCPHASQATYASAARQMLADIRFIRFDELNINAHCRVLIFA